MELTYVGVGVCNRCSMPNHVFHNPTDEVPIQRCASCYEYITGSNVIAGRNPTIDVPNCEACGRPEHITEGSDTQRWQLITAYKADMQTELRVHWACSTASNQVLHCEECDIVYATTRYTDWRSIINTSGYMTITRIEGDNLCDNCAQDYYDQHGGEAQFNTCPACDDITHRDNCLWFDGELYCEGCHDSSVYTCDYCGTEQWDGNGHHCEDDEDNSESSIHSYSYRPTPYFFGKGQYYLGFELEIEARNNSRYEGAELVQGELGSHAYMKDDGSLSDGFEVVTHPHTLDEYQKNFNWDFIPKLKREGYRSWNTDTCGLHVHVSRTAFGNGDIPWRSPDRDQLILKRQAHELRFMKLIYDNQRQVERIAGRSANNYATFADKGRLVHKLKFGNQSSGRYSAINTENDSTLEVRVFKGSLRKERVLSALEFVAASVEYTRDLKVTSKNQALTWLRFTAYVSDNMETYPNLALIMSESFASDNNPYEN